MIKWFKTKTGQVWVWVKETGKWVVFATLAAASIAGYTLLPQEEILHPVVEVNGQVIEFPYTDSLVGEDLYIWTDKGSTSTPYTGWNEIEILMAIENKSGKTQQTKIRGLFGEGTDIISIHTLEQDVEYSFERSVFTQQCDSITSTSTGEIFETCREIKTGTEMATSTRDIWVNLSLGSELRNIGDFNSKKRALHIIKKDTTEYYKVVISVPRKQIGEFLFEVEGDLGGIGLLDPWFDSNWGFKMKITIASSSINETLTNFPVYLNLLDLGSDFRTNASSTGNDLRLVSSTETGLLDHELVFIDTNSSTSTGELYFRAESLSSTTDNIFYIYYKNDAASSISTSSAWNTDYKGVYHFEGNGNDATRNANNLTINGATATTTGAKFGQAYSFDGNDYIEADIVVSGGSFPFSFQAWVKVSANGVLMWQGDKDANDVWQRIFMVDGAPRCYSRNGATDIVIQGSSPVDRTGIYQYSTCDFAADDDRKLYVNTVIQASSTTAVAIGATDRTSIGRNARASAGDFIQGEIDEVRILAAVLSLGWKQAAYLNTTTSTDFYTIGAQETEAARRMWNTLLE